MILNATNIYRKYSSNELLRRLFLASLSSNNRIANNSGEIFQRSLRLLGPRIFSKLFKPLVYDVFIGGNEEKEILHSMEKLQSRGLTPFLSPMLEDEPGPKCRKEDESLELIREKNFRKIQQCIDYVSQQVQNEEERAIAIKLTAFIPISTLESVGEEFGLKQNSALTSGMIQTVFCQLETSGEYSFWSKLKEVCQRCAQQQVNLYIDAEYSHLQPVVRTLTLALMMIGPRCDNFVIFNTYQCYLKDCQKYLMEDLQIAKDLNFPNWGCKLVRGAYLKSETQNFQAGHLETFPLHHSYEETNTSYHSAMDLVISHMKECKHLYLTIATHNVKSIETGLDFLAETSSLENRVCFAQINGLADPLSLALAQRQARVLKLLPCGSIEEVLPWLGRRLQENNQAVDRMKTDKQLIKTELLKRLVHY